MELIDKEKVIKEVKKVYDEGYKFLPSDINESVEDFKYDLLRVLDTLEVKEVDLDKEIENWLVHGHIADTRYNDYDDNDIESTAKHFYELGLNARKGW